MSKKISPTSPESTQLKIRVLMVKGMAPKRSPLGVFFHAFPEYDNPEGEQKVRAVWNTLRADEEITKKMESLFSKKPKSKKK